LQRSLTVGFINQFLGECEMEMLKRFINDERGLETVEYAIILGLIVAGTIGLVIAIGTWVHDAFASANTLIQTGG